MSWLNVSFLLLLLHLVNSDCPIHCNCKQDYIDCSNKHLTSITNDLLLEFVGTGGFQDSLFNNVKAIRTLNLANNQLNELPTVLLSESFPNLLNLDLSFNKITEITNIQTVVLNKHLLHFSVSSNPIHHLGNSTDTVLYSQSISHLDLSNCNINSITDPVTFMFMLNLTYLDLSGNPLVIVNHLVSNSLMSLDLSRCMLGYIDQGIRDESLEQLPNIYYLNISKNAHYTRFPVSKQLSNSLLYLDASMCALETLDLKPFPNLKQAIFKGNIIKILHNYTIYNNKYLQILDLSENSVHHIDKFTFAGCISLEILDLSQNLLTRFDWITLLETPRLRVLNISRNFLTYLNDLPPLSLNAIDASYCDISILSSKFLDKAVNIKYLNLSHNSLEKVTNSLTNSKLIWLDLSFCHISEFEDEPSKPSNLLYLNMMGNRLSNPLKQNLINHLSHVKDINLLKNPWHCDCNDLDFHIFWKYLFKKSNYSNRLICQTPKSHNGLTLERSCIEPFRQNEEAMIKNKTLLSLLVSLLILFCLIGIMFVIRHAYFSYQLDYQQRDIESSRSIENSNRRLALRMAPHLIDGGSGRNSHIYSNESYQRELSKLPSYEEALLLPKPQSREDLKRIVDKYEESDRFARAICETSQCSLHCNENLQNNPSTSRQ